MVLVVAACGSADDPEEAATVATSVATEPTAATVVSTTTVATTTTTTSTVAPVTTTPTTTAPTTTTTAPPTTTIAPTTTTTPGGPYFAGVPDLYPPTPLPGSDGAGASGCAPGAGALPDGVWFGYVRAIGSTTVELDLACFYFGDIAYTEGAEDGEEVNNDYYVRNVNPTLRTVPVATVATVYEIEATSGGFLTVPFVDWPVDPSGYIACPSDWCGVWLFVNGGDATEILEQYIP